MTFVSQPSYYELGPIRPPSEAHSLLIRVTRNCPWNRCTFCSTYKGTRFELRSVDEVKRDIAVAKAVAARIRVIGEDTGSLADAASMAYRAAPDDCTRNTALWLYAGGTSAFLQDADSLIGRTPQLVEIISFLKETFPSLNRITSYCRSKTAARKSSEELLSLRDAGLSRAHVGLESGCDEVLAYMDKGVTAKNHMVGGKKIVESGISLSEYVIPGLGGRRWRSRHAADTASVLNEINPDFIRLRSISVRAGMPLYGQVQSGEFEVPSEDEIVEEIGWLIEGLRCRSEIKSDHDLNLLPEIDGKLPEDKDQLLKTINTYLEMSDIDRENFSLGRRTGYYYGLSDMADPARREQVDRLLGNLKSQGEKVDQVLADLRSRRM